MTTAPMVDYKIHWLKMMSVPESRAVVGRHDGINGRDSRGQDSLRRCWRTVCGDAGLGRLRLHDLRHSMASHAVMSGENLPLVGKLLGHRRHRTTAGYAHLADGHLVEAAERVGRIIANAMITMV